MPVVVDGDAGDVLTPVRTAEIETRPSIPSARIHTGFVNRAGTVNAVTFPFSYGMRKPAWREQQIAYTILGVAGDSVQNAQGAAARMFDASAGAFRLNASMVFPALVNPNGSAHGTGS
jgi:hypothetical protein